MMANSVKAKNILEITQVTIAVLFLWFRIEIIESINAKRNNKGDPKIKDSGIFHDRGWSLITNNRTMPRTNTIRITAIFNFL